MIGWNRVAEFSRGAEMLPGRACGGGGRRGPREALAYGVGAGATIPVRTQHPWAARFWNQVASWSSVPCRDGLALPSSPK